ncbi:serine/threonine-protein kinase [Nonomuraea insulae]|uniref:non-specific serine/threonine protein kinase n=1 Tax=Nonomuraea insulae TaxID=1616787 RepID=A0ABW1CL95_9ACTN
MISPGTELAGRYRLLSRLGGGGHGEVWRAQDTRLDRVVAVKMIRAGLDDDPEFVARFLAEARSMAAVDHPGVVGVFDYGIAELHGRRTPYLVMKYLDGEPLHRLLSRRGRIAAGATMDLVAQAAEALQAAHEAGVVHRDVKPGNLVIRSDGTVVLTDFGIARTAEALKLTASGIVMGTATYCAPEQAEGVAPSPAMDVYALGVVAYECLAGRVPFDGESAVAIALKHLHEPPPPLPDDTPAAVAEVVMRALAKNPVDRWPSASALATAARALVDVLDAGHPLAEEQAESRALPPDSSARQASPSAVPLDQAAVSDGASDGGTARRLRRPALTVAGGLAAVAIAAAATWSLVRTDPPSPSALQARVRETPPSTAAEPSPDLLTHVKDDDEPRDRPATPDTSTPPGASREPDTSTTPPAPAAGLLVGGIFHLGGPSPGQSVADGYQAGLVEVFTGKGKRLAGRRSDQRGFRFSLPPGRYRLQTALGDGTCSATGVVKPGRTTRADLKCKIPQLPPPEPAFHSAAVKDARGDAKGGPDAGKAPPYSDLLGAAMKAGPDGVTLEFVTAGAIPALAPSEGNSSSRWAVSVEQGGKTAVVSLTGRQDTWTLQWVAQNDKTDPADESDPIDGDGQARDLRGADLHCPRPARTAENDPDRFQQAVPDRRRRVERGPGDPWLVGLRSVMGHHPSPSPVPAAERWSGQPLVPVGSSVRSAPGDRRPP